VRARDGVATGFLAATTILAALLASAVTAANLAPTPIQPKQDNTIVMKGGKERPARIVPSDPALLGRTDSTLVPILVKLDYDAVTDYAGDIPGLASTNPDKTGKKFKQNKDAVDAYTRYVIAYESKVLDRIKVKVPTAKISRSLRTIYGGVAMTLPANRIDDLLSVDGVVAVRQDSLEQPQRPNGSSR
jgi:hypothetical protein